LPSDLIKVSLPGQLCIVSRPKTPSCIEQRDWLPKQLYWPGLLDTFRSFNKEYSGDIRDVDGYPAVLQLVLEKAEMSSGN